MTKTGEAARPTPDSAEESITDWLVLHQRSLLIGVIVVAAGAGGGWLWKRSAEIKETRAAEALLVAESAFASGNAPLAQTELDKITTRWSGTAAGAQAAMLSAQLQFDQGKYAEGIASLTAMVGSAPKEMRAGIHGLIGAGREGAGQWSEAAAAFQQAAGAARFELEAQSFRMDAARNLTAAGDVEGAKAIYAEIRVLDDSPYAGEAKVRFGELLAKK